MILPVNQTVFVFRFVRTQDVTVLDPRREVGRHVGKHSNDSIFERLRLVCFFVL